MQDIINYLADQWQRSGNPAWLKGSMIVLLVILLGAMVHMVRDMIREHKRLRLEQLQAELAEKYKKQFHYEGKVPHGKKTY
jgi:hypothetical protein